MYDQRLMTQKGRGKIGRYATYLSHFCSHIKELKESHWNALSISQDHTGLRRHSVGLPRKRWNLEGSFKRLRGYKEQLIHVQRSCIHFSQWKSKILWLVECLFKVILISTVTLYYIVVKFHVIDQTSVNQLLYSSKNSCNWPIFNCLIKRTS